MIPAVDPLGDRPVTSDRDLVAFVVSNPFRLLLEDPDAELIFVLIARPSRRPERSTTFPYPLTEVAVTAVKEEDAELTSAAVYLSTHPFRTRATDEPANVTFDPRLQSALSFRSSIPLPGSGQSVGRFAAGDLLIDNKDGGVDELLGASWEGRFLEIKVGGTLKKGHAGEKTLVWSEFGTIFRGTADALESLWDDSEDSGLLTLSVRDPMARLDVDFQRTLYAGTGGLEGSELAKGIPKPKAFGRVNNVPLLLLDAANLIYQGHDARINGGPGPGGRPVVRDNGAELTFDAEVADIEATAAPSPGFWKFQRDPFYVRLGATPSGAITCDFFGDDDLVDGYTEEVSGIARRIATKIGGLLDPDEIDAIAFANFPSRGPCGIWIGPEPTTVETVLDQVIVGADGWLTFTRDGRLRIGPFVGPEFSTAVSSMQALESVTSVRTRKAPVPAWRVRIGHSRNYLVQDPDGLAGAVSADDRDRYSKEFLFEVRESESVRDQQLLAVDLTIPSILMDGTAAADLALEVFSRERLRRVLAELERTRSVFQDEIGQVMKLEQFPAALRTGQFLIVGIAEEPLERITTLTLWGAPGKLQPFSLGETGFGEGLLT